MKIVLDNIIFSLQKAGGISFYWFEILKRFSNKGGDLTVCENKNDNIFRQKLTIPNAKTEFSGIKILRYLPLSIRIPSKSIFHSSYYRLSLQKNVVNIITVYDFTYEYFKKGLPRFIHQLQKKIAIRNADGIICISESTKNDLMKFNPKIKENKIKVIYLSSGGEFKNLDSPKDKLSRNFPKLRNKKFILYVGDRSEYKKFELAIEVVRQLKNFSLVVAGVKDFSNEERKKIIGFDDRIYLFKFIKSEELNILYNNAFCFLYPSSYEGFGIPVLEAMKAGCPVVSTNLSSIPEVAGNAALLVNELSANAFIDQIKKLDNPEFRKDIIQKGFIQASKFSWDKCFIETMDFYKDVYKAKFGGNLED